MMLVFSVLFHTACIALLFKILKCRKFDTLDMILIIISYAISSVIVHVVVLASLSNNAVSNVYQSPMFTVDECNSIIAIAEHHAEQRGGWEKSRHRSYPTTDICAFDIAGNISMNGVSQNFVSYVNSTLSRRVYPLISSYYGIPLQQLSARDIFIVKYDAESPGGQRRLREHQDHSEISFNIALSNMETDFTGGGTRFVISDTVVNTQKGNILFHESGLFHAGYPIQSGVRYILVGFINVSPLPWYGAKYYGSLAHCIRFQNDNSQDEHCRSWIWMIRYVLVKSVRDIWSSSKESDILVKRLLIFLMGVVVVLIGLLIGLCIYWKDDDSSDVDFCDSSIASFSMESGRISNWNTTKKIS